MAKLTTKTFQGMDLNDFADLAYQEGWSDGLPVLPPTEKRVGDILAYLERDPAEVVGVIPPGEGVATMEQIAINCAMAGCKPEYVPIVVAAVQAMLADEFQLMRVQTSTAGAVPCAIISGPVVKQLGFNYDRGVASGDGSRANGTIGRAIALILWNCGLGRAERLSHATFGHLGKYCFLLAERPPDDGNPWEQFHVSEAGLKPGDSAITMFPAGRHEQIGTGAGLVQSLDDLVTRFARGFDRLGHMHEASHKLSVMNPLASQVFAEAGWSKTQVRDAMIEKAQRSVRDLKKTGGSATKSYWWEGLVDIDNDDALVPAISSPEFLSILVSGGWPSPGANCLFIDSAHGAMVTRKIDWRWRQDVR
jgi:hypothetical protein